MGWLVQAEAPPGMLFRAFRKVVVDGKASESDIAFYFTHWFCDLAGAEPVPLQGCEKFVLKFPQKVLKNFLDSFPIVWRLSPTKTETMVLQDYLEWRWSLEEQFDIPHIPPTGKGAIAMMRLTVMAQGDSAEIVKQFKSLDVNDRQILSDELALTGLDGQLYTCDDAYTRRPCGPALLIYYSPALMQKAGRKDPRGALMALAEVFRQARELWPPTSEPKDIDSTVIIRIDAIKDLDMPQIRNPEAGTGFVLKKNSSLDGMIRVVPIKEFKDLDWNLHQPLIFGQAPAGGQHQRKKPSAFAAVGRRISRTSARFMPWLCKVTGSPK